MIAGIGAFLVRLATGVRQDFGVPAPRGPRVYFANHSSHLDFIVIWAALEPGLRRRVRPVAAADYWEKGAIRRWLAKRVFNAVLIPRGKITRSDDPVGAMTAVLEAGSDLIIFPEGTRGDGDKVADFKPGLYALAAHCPSAELVPVHLENLSRILPKGELLAVPLIASVTFGPPCDGPREGEPKPEFSRRARQALVALCGGETESPVP